MIFFQRASKTLQRPPHVDDMTTPAVHSVVVWARSLAAALQDAPGILPDFTIIGLCAVVLCLLLLANTHPPPIATLARSSHCTGSKHGDTSHWNLSLKKTRQCLSRSISNVGGWGCLSSCQTWLFFNIEFPEDQRPHDPNAWRLRGKDTDSHGYGNGRHHHTPPLPPEVLLLFCLLLLLFCLLLAQQPKNKIVRLRDQDTTSLTPPPPPPREYHNYSTPNPQPSLVFLPSLHYPFHSCLLY